MSQLDAGPCERAVPGHTACPRPEPGPAEARADVLRARLATLNRHMHHASCDVRRACAPLSVQQREALEELLFADPSYDACMHDHYREVLARVAPDVLAPLRTLLTREHDLHTQWDKVRSEIYDDNALASTAYVTAMRRELVGLDDALCASGIEQIVGGGGNEDLQSTVLLVAMQQKQLQQRLNRVFRWGVPTAPRQTTRPETMNALHYLRRAEYNGMHVSGHDWRKYEGCANCAARALENWLRSGDGPGSDGSDSQCCCGPRGYGGYLSDPEPESDTDAPDVEQWMWDLLDLGRETPDQSPGRAGTVTDTADARA